MATNPLPPFVPCHRVVGASGALTGFSAPGGVRLKARLLRDEARAKP
jgi:methylated-DNA-[protein]-cysteine S-methyltransferase